MPPVEVDSSLDGNFGRGSFSMEFAGCNLHVTTKMDKLNTGGRWDLE